jgi:mannosyltransferase
VTAHLDLAVAPDSATSQPTAQSTNRTTRTPTLGWRLVERDKVLVAGLVALAFALRAPNLGRAYWIDEGISVGIASHHAGQIPSLLTRDGSPPLFYFLLHYWMALFGTSEIATHFLPLVVSLAAIPIAYWSGSSLFDRRAGRWAAALMATNPFLSWYSTETRMYTLLIVLVMVGLTFAVRAVRDRSRRDAVAAIVSYAALLYTHNWGVYAVVATVVVLAGTALRQGDRRLARHVVLAGLAAAALWLPWLPFFVDQARSTAAPWAVRPNIGNFFADQAFVLGGTLNFAIAPLLAAGAWFTRPLRSRADGSLASALCAVGVLTGVAGFLGAELEPSWTVRYLAVIVAPLLLASAGAMATSARGRAVLTGTCALLAGWSLIGAILPNPSAPYAKSNVAAVAKAADPQLGAGDVVVVTQTEQLAVLYHYLPQGLVYVTPTGPVTDPSVVDWRNIVRRLQHADPCRTVDPAVENLPVGAHVLEVNPVHKLGARGSAWSKAVTAQVEAVDHLLATDPALVAIGSYAEATSPRPYSPVVGELFRKVAGVGPCAGA